MRFLRFLLVGSVGFLLDTLLLAQLHYGLGFDPFSARLLSITAAALVTWRLNRAITFGGSGVSQAEEGLRYGIVTAATACFNYAVYAALLIAWPALPPLLAMMLAAAAALGLSYAGYSRVVFAAEPAVLVSPSSQRR